jgi:2-aminoadipate transaminase
MTSIADAKHESTTGTLYSLFSKRGRNVSPPRVGDPKQSARLYSFIYGFPDSTSLPAQSMIGAAASALARDGEWALQYGPTTGAPPLVSVLIDKLARDQEVIASHENVLITAGGSQACQLILDLFVDWGDTVIVEAPTWMGFIWALKNVGANVESIPLCEDGIDTDTLNLTLERLRTEGRTPKLIYVMPNFQNPSGISMSLDKRKRLISLAQEFGTVILEDDAYHDLRFAGERLPTIYSLDKSGSTIYTATFSKIIGAGIRLGWLVAPKQVIDHLQVLKMDGGTNIFGSYIAAEWIPNNLREHIEQLKQIYKRRKTIMIDALNRHMPDGSTWTDPEGGFFVWLTLPKGIDTASMLAGARERGVEYLPGSTCYVNGEGRNQIRLSFSFASDDQIEPGIRILGEIIKGERLESKSHPSEKAHQVPTD